MGVTYYPDGVQIGSEAGGTADFKLGGTTVTRTAAQINALLAGTASGFKAHGGTIVFTLTGGVATGLSTFVGWSAVLVGAPDLAANGIIQISAGTAAGGSITVAGYKADGTAAGAAAIGTAAWTAFGT